MAEAFYKSVPTGMLKHLEHRHCSQCGTKIDKSNVIACGVRIHAKKLNPYVEHQCPACDYREMTTLDAGVNFNIDRLCYVILEHNQKRRAAEKAKSRNIAQAKKKSISDQEVLDLLRFMDTTEDYNDIMKYIGADKHLEISKDEPGQTKS